MEINGTKKLERGTIMKFCYNVIKEKFENELLGEYMSFGIIVEDVDSNEINRISDISVEYDTVKYISDLCNELELEPIHLMDVVEDMI